MKTTNLKSLIVSFFVVGLCFLVFISNTEAAVFYVSMGGSDTDNRPVATKKLVLLQ